MRVFAFSSEEKLKEQEDQLAQARTHAQDLANKMKEFETAGECMNVAFSLLWSGDLGCTRWVSQVNGGSGKMRSCVRISRFRMMVLDE